MPIRSFDEAKDLNRDIVIGKASREDAFVFVNLVNKQYQRKKDSSFYYWMFMNTCLPTRLIAAFDKGVPRAFYGIQIHKLNNGINCGVSVEIIIEDKYRGRGLFVLLENEAYKFALSHNAASMTVFGNYNGMKAHENLSTWRAIAKIDTLIFDCRNELVIKNDLGDYLPGREFLVFSKDTEYRKWRFDSSPVYDYDRVSLSKNIFALTKIFEDLQNKTRFGDIVDFECDLNNTAELRALFVKSCKHLMEQKVRFITCWALPHTPLCGVLKSLGFSSLPQERYFSVRVLDHQNDYLNDIKNWHLVQSDSEVY